MKIKKQNKPTKAVKAVKKERVIWTVQPEPDVEALVNALCSNAPWGERSRLINEAIREKFAEASAMMQAATEAQEKLAKTAAAAAAVAAVAAAKKAPGPQGKGEGKG